MWHSVTTPSRFWRTMSLPLLSLTVTAPAAFSQQSLIDRKQFFEADQETVRRVWNARELDPNKPLDRRVLDVMTQAQNAARISAPLFWKNAGGTQTHPRLGIGLDSTQLLRMVSEDGAESFQPNLALILSHELAHVAQFKQYALNNFADTSKARAIEAQADIFAGMNFMWMLLAERLDSTESGARMSMAATRIAAMGSHDYDPGHHPRSEQRARAFNTGLVAGLQLMDLRSCKQGAAAACRRAEKGKTSTDFHDFDEEVWAWSNRLAKRITQYAGK